MKRILSIFLLVVSFCVSMPSVAQYNYKYLFTENANGARSQRPNLVDRFNTGNLLTTLRFTNKSNAVNFDYNNNTVFTVTYQGTENNIFHYQGPVVPKMNGWQPGVGIDPNALADNVMAPIMMQIYFGVPKGSNSTIDVYFSPDFKRMNIRPRGTPGVTHVFEQGSANKAPSQLL